jgi:DeoR/GlpR family transcriptional regulator of sugar metabolism
MPREDRRQNILMHLRRHETASVEQLAELAGVSRMTIHRDLDRLAERRMVRKTRGGATLLPSVVFEADYTFRESLCRPAKQALARRIGELIEPGMAVFLDDSTTTAALVPTLREKRPLTIITNALGLINALAREEDISVTCLGGQYSAVADGFFGLVCEAAVSRLRADLGIFSTAAVQGASAYLHDPEIVRAKLAMMAASDQTVLAFDSSKFGKSAFNLFSPLVDFDHVFLTGAEEIERIDVLRKAQVSLELIEANETSAMDQQELNA